MELGYEDEARILHSLMGSMHAHARDQALPVVALFSLDLLSLQSYVDESCGPGPQRAAGRQRNLSLPPRRLCGFWKRFELE